MKSLTDCFVLNNGVEIPCVGFGTWQTPDGDVAVASVKAAIACGYRHIDTAAAYNNEKSVGIAVKESGVKREDLFITSKLANPCHGYDATMRAFDQTLEQLDMQYLDLYLIHWPNPAAFRDHWQEANAGTWRAFEENYNAGRIRALGISNFMPHHIRALMQTATVAPAVNQIRLCPGCVDEATVQYCSAHDILLEAYSPLGTGKIFDVPQMQQLSEKYGKTIAQICLRWSLQQGFLPLPKSVTPSRICQNAQLFDFELAPEDIAALDALEGRLGYSNHPDHIDF